MIINNQIELYKNKKFNELIIIYNNQIELYKEYDIITYNKILFNRCLCYLLLKKYNNAFNDALKITENNNISAKAWGYLGASLYGLNIYEEAIIAYNKAYDLSINQQNNDIYLQMINDLKNQLFLKKNLKLKNILSKKINNPQLEEIFNNLYNTIITNPKIINKFTDSNFQTKLLNFQNKPEDALKDTEISGIINDLINNFK